jgi:DNA-directed RNA polymerase specialized sigma24 family protein/tetratricopeptide (TPR) repeat protein
VLVVIARFSDDVREKNWAGIGDKRAMREMSSDAELLMRSVSDPPAFAALYERHGHAVRRYVARRVGSEAGEDLAAEVFVRAFRARGRYRAERDSALPWLLGVANHVIAGHRRSEVRRLKALERLAGAAPRLHPLRSVLGQLAGGGVVTRVALTALSRSAVAELADGSAVDADQLYERTAGNPFFVTEALATGTDSVPPTVRDAVLARTAGLSGAARALLDAISIVPQEVDMWLLEALIEDQPGILDESLRSGILHAGTASVAFRHELARLAVEASLTPDVRLGLHRRALAALVASSPGAPDLARLAHHAEGAMDTEAVLRCAPAAAEHAASLGAHREAVGQFARALRFAQAVAPEARADLLTRFSNECFLTDMRGDAIQALNDALAIHRDRGDVAKEGETQRRRAQLLACYGRADEARAAAAEAVERLKQCPPSRELALAYSSLSLILMHADEGDAAIEWGTRATSLAERVGDTEALVHGLINVGTVEFNRGAREGREGLEKLERSMMLAGEAGLPGEVGRAYVNVAAITCRRREWALADPYISRGIEHCHEHGLDVYLGYVTSARGESELARGHWNDAAETAAAILSAPMESVLAPQHSALTVLALIRSPALSSYGGSVVKG